MRKRILDAARDEFARRGSDGARIERIARAARANKRMLYYHVGNKDALYLEVLEGAYAHIRDAERRLNLEALAPPDAIARLIEFTWQYFIEYPEFMALLNNENLHRARYLKRSKKIKEMHSPLINLLADILRKGVATGEFRSGVDPVQLYISIASLSYFYLSNNATLSTIFGRDLMSADARAKRLNHMTDLVLAALRRGSPAKLDRLLVAS
jgi:AcrR family transcriptional regulator